jgi:hypothetical protein
MQDAEIPDDAGGSYRSLSPAIPYVWKPGLAFDARHSTILK